MDDAHSWGVFIFCMKILWLLLFANRPSHNKYQTTTHFTVFLAILMRAEVNRQKQTEITAFVFVINILWIVWNLTRSNKQILVEPCKRLLHWHGNNWESNSRCQRHINNQFKMTWMCDFWGAKSFFWRHSFQSDQSPTKWYTHVQFMSDFCQALCHLVSDTEPSTTVSGVSNWNDERSNILNKRIKWILLSSNHIYSCAIQIMP